MRNIKSFLAPVLFSSTLIISLLVSCSDDNSLVNPLNNDFKNGKITITLHGIFGSFQVSNKVVYKSPFDSVYYNTYFKFDTLYLAESFYDFISVKSYLDGVPSENSLGPYFKIYPKIDNDTLTFQGQSRGIYYHKNPSYTDNASLTEVRIVFNYHKGMIDYCSINTAFHSVYNYEDQESASGESNRFQKLIFSDIPYTLQDSILIFQILSSDFNKHFKSFDYLNNNRSYYRNNVSPYEYNNYDTTRFIPENGFTFLSNTILKVVIHQ